jgi:phospholipase C
MGGVRLAGLAVAAMLLAAPVQAAPIVTKAPPFRHVVVVVFENKEYGSIIGKASAARFNRLAKRFALLTRSYGVTHPSLPNYIALVSGSTHGIDSNCTKCSVDARSLADTLEAAGKTWKTYAEGLPEPGWTGATSGDYAKKHDPFLYFDGIVSNDARRKRVVPYTHFAGDLAAGRLPDFSLVVPDLCHSMHDCSVKTGDAWLSAFIDPVLRSPELKGSVVFVTFDEGSSDVNGGGHIATLAVGPTVRRGARFTAATNHYGLLRTIEDAWGLPRLGESATATPVTGIWKSG